MLVAAASLGLRTTPLGRRVWQQAQRTPLHVLAALLLAALLLGGVVLGMRWHRRSHCTRPRDGSADPLGYTDPMAHRSTAYKSSAALARPPHACAEALKIPQVALLFLTKGAMHHERMWQRWFQSVAGQVHVASVQAALCRRSTREAGRQAALEACAAYSAGEEQDGRGVVGRQHLFDVWIHPPMGFAGFPEGSIFRGLELPPSHRVATSWGSHSLVDATRALLAGALTNPHAQRFVLLSESDVPLYSPHALYLQLMGERRSRVNACNRSGWEPDEGYRWRHDMHAAGIPRHLWRKSWQWVGLTREHAALVVEDSKVDFMFRSTCRRQWDSSWCDHRVCYSDEHYVPTLLAFHGRDNETDCTGELTDRDWSRVPVGTPHPYEYPPGDVTPQLMQQLRHEERQGCGHASKAASAAVAAFREAGGLLDPGKGHGTRRGDDTLRRLCNATPAPKFRGLGPSCPLLARKFLNETADAVLAALAPCSGVLGPAEPGVACPAWQLHANSSTSTKMGSKLHSWNFPWAVAAAVGLAAAGIALRCWRRCKRQRRTSSMARNQTFHTALREQGII